MLRKVVKSFTYAADGRMPRLMKAGRSYAFPADHAARFEVEGYLEPLAGGVVPVSNLRIYAGEDELAPLPPPDPDAPAPELRPYVARGKVKVSAKRK